MRNKKGQILIIVLLVMAIGLIVISPLLRYIDTSYNIYLSNLRSANAYYAADALMQQIMRDLYSGQDIYYNNRSTPYTLSLNGCDVYAVINDSVADPLPPLETDEDAAEWAYLDPGVSLNYLTLPKGSSYAFPIFLPAGGNITVNWRFSVEPWCGWRLCFILLYDCCPASIYPSGNLSVINQSGSIKAAVGRSGSATPVTLNLSYTVPPGGSGNYSIVFYNNNSKRMQTHSYCTPCAGTLADAPSYSMPFSGIGETDYTWVRIGKAGTGGKMFLFQDYTVTVMARIAGKNVFSITACLRQRPGAFNYNQEQTVDISSWQLKDY